MNSKGYHVPSRHTHRLTNARTQVHTITMAAKPQSLYDSYPLPDGGGDGVDLEEEENDGEVVSAESLLLHYRATSKDVQRIASYLATFVAGTAVESPVVYEDIGVRRGGWHPSGDKGCKYPYASNSFRFGDNWLQWMVARREKGETVVPLLLDLYGRPARGPARAAPETKETELTDRGPATVVVEVKKMEPAEREADGLPRCNMTISDLLKNVTRPGYEVAALKCAYCTRPIALHD